jgi:hypothetical protein
MPNELLDGFTDWRKDVMGTKSRRKKEQREKAIYTEKTKITKYEKIAITLSIINSIILLISIPFLSPIVYKKFQKPEFTIGLSKTETENVVNSIFIIENIGRSLATNFKVKFVCLSTDRIEVLDSPSMPEVKRLKPNTPLSPTLKMDYADITLDRFPKNSKLLIHIQHQKKDLEYVNSREDLISAGMQFPQLNGMLCDQLGDIDPKPLGK